MRGRDNYYSDVLWILKTPLFSRPYLSPGGEGMVRITSYWLTHTLGVAQGWYGSGLWP